MFFKLLVLSISVHVCMSETACPKGWKKENERCYYISSDLCDTSNFAFAKDFCEKQSASLVEITDQDEQDFLADLVTDAFWIGLTNTNDDWTLLDLVTVPTITNWIDVENNNNTHLSTQYDCAVMSYLGQWSDRDCETSQNYIACEKGTTEVEVNGCPAFWTPYNDTCYYTDTTAATYADATSESACPNGGSILTPICAAEEQYVSDKIQTIYWLPYSDSETEGTFKTADGGDFDYGQTWIEGQPSALENIEEDCAAGVGGLVFDDSCDKKHRFACTIAREPFCLDGWTLSDDKTHCYQYFSVAKSHDGANSACQGVKAGAELYTPKSAEEDAFVTGLASVTADYWIGYDNRKSSWIWTNYSGDNAIYKHFAQYEPTITCAMVIKSDNDTNGKWRDDFCDVEKPYVCEVPPESFPNICD